MRKKLNGHRDIFQIPYPDNNLILFTYKNINQQSDGKDKTESHENFNRLNFEQNT